MSGMTSERMAEVRLIIEREILGRNAIAGARYATQELDAAGLLATPAHDVAVAARALREAATLDFTVAAQRWLHDRADRLEIEGGASDG